MHFAILYDANALINTLPATHTHKFRQSARGQRSVWLQDQLTELLFLIFIFLFFLSPGHEWECDIGFEEQLRQK